MTRIFISYSRVDSDITKKLKDALNLSFDYVWYDTEKIVGGDKWWPRILEEISQCNHFIILLSPESVKSEYCQKELAEAIELGKNVIPVLIRARTVIPENLSDTHYIEMFSDLTVQGINQIYASIIRKTGDLRKSDYLLELKEFSLPHMQRETDFSILKKLWPLINDDFFFRLERGIREHKVDEHDYVYHLPLYTLNRRESEFTFIDNHLEHIFRHFDAHCEMFVGNFEYQYGSSKIIDGKNYLVLFDDINASSRQLEVLISLERLREMHRELVSKLKSIFPEFDFQREY